MKGISSSGFGERSNNSNADIAAESKFASIDKPKLCPECGEKYAGRLYNYFKEYWEYKHTKPVKKRTGRGYFTETRYCQGKC